MISVKGEKLCGVQENIPDFFNNKLMTTLCFNCEEAPFMTLIQKSFPLD